MLPTKRSAMALARGAHRRPDGPDIGGGEHRVVDVHPEHDGASACIRAQRCQLNARQRRDRRVSGGAAAIPMAPATRARLRDRCVCARGA